MRPGFGGDDDHDEKYEKYDDAMIEIMIIMIKNVIIMIMVFEVRLAKRQCCTH